MRVITSQNRLNIKLWTKFNFDMCAKFWTPLFQKLSLTHTLKLSEKHTNTLHPILSCWALVPKRSKGCGWHDVNTARLMLQQGRCTQCGPQRCPCSAPIYKGSCPESPSTDLGAAPEPPPRCCWSCCLWSCWPWAQLRVKMEVCIKNGGE